MLPYVYVSMKPCRIDKKNIYSINSRNEGDILFIERKFDEALFEYNSAISYALPNSRDLAIAYYKRAVVYLQCKKFSQSLENIQWARECNLSKSVSGQLNRIEEKCKFAILVRDAEALCEMLEVSTRLTESEVNSTDQKFDPWSFFKLFANCLFLHFRSAFLFQFVH